MRGVRDGIRRFIYWQHGGHGAVTTILGALDAYSDVLLIRGTQAIKISDVRYRRDSFGALAGATKAPEDARQVIPVRST